jgi:NAD-dependent dihydropyrimidine dehydrogenase PreA subunit
MEAVGFARSALAAAGMKEDLVTLEPGEIGQPMNIAPVTDPFTWSGDLAVMMTMSAITGDQAEVRHAGSSTARVTIDPATCTLCAQCARTCPTDAIEAAYDGDVVSISFDPSRCTNCRQCLMACPETDRGAIDVTGMFDREQVVKGRTDLHRGSVLVCESCGDPIAPSPMMDRIGQLLGDEFGDTMQYLSRRCLDCRGAS